MHAITISVKETMNLKEAAAAGQGEDVYEKVCWEDRERRNVIIKS